MKKIGLGLLGTLAAVLIFGPTLCALVDAGWWFLTDHQLTWINWTEGRQAYAAIAWFLIPTIVIVCAAILL